MPHIFISYSRQDEAFARQLATSLSHMGADIWIDLEDIPAGMKWSSAIQQGLDSGNVLIVIISPASMASRNVEDEWQYYLDSHKPVIPVLLHPAKIHFQLNRIQYIDFHNQPYDPALRQLYTELARNGIHLTPNMADPAVAYRPTPHQYPPQPVHQRRPFPLKALLVGGFVLVGLVAVSIIALLALNNPPPVPTGDISTDRPLLSNLTSPTPAPTTVRVGFPGSPVARNTDWSPTTGTFSNVSMVLVPVGCFMMGSTPAHIDSTHQQCQAALGTCDRANFEDESPQGQVCFEQPFWMDRTEVSNAIYGSPGTFWGDTSPRTNITWDQAQAHCQARGARLPTEAEWEYAARGPDGLLYPWGSQFDGSRLNFCDGNCEFTDWRDSSVSDGYGIIAPVDAFANGASWVGALNMSGNVWEWTSTIYNFSYPYAANDGRENTADLAAKRVLRGGSWNWIAADARAAARDDYAGNNSSSDWYGFRCVRDFQPGDL